MKRPVVLVVLAGFLAVAMVGCAIHRNVVNRGEYAVTRSTPPETRRIQSYTPGIPVTKTIGEPMIERGSLIVYQAFELTEALPPSVKGVRWKCDRLIHIDNIWQFLCSPVNSPTMWGNEHVTYYDIAIKKSAEVIGSVVGDRLTRRTQKFIGEKYVPVEILQEGSHKNELIYTGKTKDTIRLSYREYNNDMARPAFFQDLTYDLSESREIAFRDLRIEVLEATNSAIKFIVKK